MLDAGKKSLSAMFCFTQTFRLDTYLVKQSSSQENYCPPGWLDPGYTWHMDGEEVQCWALKWYKNKIILNKRAPTSFFSLESPQQIPESCSRQLSKPHPMTIVRFGWKPQKPGRSLECRYIFFRERKIKGHCIANPPQFCRQDSASAFTYTFPEQWGIITFQLCSLSILP